MTERPVSAAVGELGLHLRAVGERAGHTGAGFAAMLGEGWAQPKVSKIENGRQLLTADEVRAWAAATGDDPEPLLDLRQRAASEYLSFRDRNRRAGGVVEHQGNLTALIESCTFLGEYQPGLVPGRLQIAAYMRNISGNEAVRRGEVTEEVRDQAIATKLRRQTILHEPGREFVHIVTEAALRMRYGTITPTTLHAQVIHLAETATLPRHTLAVIPFTVTCPVPFGFALYDQALVRVETAGGALELTDTDALTRYRERLDQLVDAALTGQDAAEFCRAVAASLPA